MLNRFDFNIYNNSNRLIKYFSKTYVLFYIVPISFLIKNLLKKQWTTDKLSLLTWILLFVTIILVIVFLFNLIKVKVINRLIIDKKNDVLIIRIEKFNINCYSVSITKNQFSFEVFKSGILEIRKLNKTVGTISKNELETYTNIKWLDLMRSIIEFKRDETKLPTTGV